MRWGVSVLCGHLGLCPQPNTRRLTPQTSPARIARMSTFALIADPHITVSNPESGWTAAPIPNEPTMYECSVELLETAIAQINASPEVDFVLIAGDLTKDSEPYNHDRARELFTRFRKPVFCVSGNHDQPRPPHMRP